MKIGADFFPESVATGLPKFFHMNPYRFHQKYAMFFKIFMEEWAE